MLIRALQPTDLLFHPNRTALPTFHKRADQLPPQRLQVLLQSHQLAVVLDEEVFILHRLGAHAPQEVSVFHVLAELGGVGPEDARPEGGEEFAFEALLGV